MCLTTTKALALIQKHIVSLLGTKYDKWLEQWPKFDQLTLLMTSTHVVAHSK
jgi:hypothetical protein